MPKKKTLTQRVTKAYEELHSMKAVSDRLDIPINAVKRRLRRLYGLTSKGGRPPKQKKETKKGRHKKTTKPSKASLKKQPKRQRKPPPFLKRITPEQKKALMREVWNQYMNINRISHFFQ